MNELAEDEIMQLRKMLWNASYKQLQGIIKDAQFLVDSRKEGEG